MPGVSNQSASDFLRCRFRRFLDGCGSLIQAYGEPTRTHAREDTHGDLRPDRINCKQAKAHRPTPRPADTPETRRTHSRDPPFPRLYPKRTGEFDIEMPGGLRSEPKATPARRSPGKALASTAASSRGAVGSKDAPGTASSSRSASPAAGRQAAPTSAPSPAAEPVLPPTPAVSKAEAFGASLPGWEDLQPNRNSALASATPVEAAAPAPAPAPRPARGHLRRRHISGPPHHHITHTFICIHIFIYIYRHVCKNRCRASLRHGNQHHDAPWSHRARLLLGLQLLAALRCSVWSGPVAFSLPAVRPPFDMAQGKGIGVGERFPPQPLLLPSRQRCPA